MRTEYVLGIPMAVLFLIFLGVLFWPVEWIQGPSECIGQGGSAGMGINCCPGLVTGVYGEGISIADMCYRDPNSYVQSSPQQLVCIDCGNGVCEDKETVCNCLEDCVRNDKSQYLTKNEFCDDEEAQTSMQICDRYFASGLPICNLCE